MWGLLRHTHFADNNRKMPGNGHIDFRSVVDSLHRIGYNGFISFEPTMTNTNYKLELWEGLEFIKISKGLVCRSKKIEIM